MEKYSSYKDSGVKWLGEIPSHWEIVPTKSCLESSTSGIWGNDPINDGSDIICLRVADFNYEKGGIRKDKLTYRNYSKELSNDKVLKDGDLLLEKSGGGDLYPVGRVVRFDSCLSTATCSNFIQILRPKKNVYSSFIYYSFYVKYARKVNALYFNQTTGIQNLKVKEYLNSPIILPPLSEQQAIATYLDKVTSQIDTAISQQQKMIDLLNERKQIIINNAVTKGLDPNVKMKDSGVDWIGEIPEGWDVRKLKHIAKTNSGSTPRSISGKDNPQSTIKWVRTTDLKNSHITDTSEYLSINEMKSASCPLLPKGTVLISMYGGEGSFGKLGLLDTEATINQALCSINCTDKIIPEFIFFYLQAIHPIWIKFAMSTRKDPNLNQQTIKNIDVVFPAIDEQMYIVSAINKSIIQIDRALDNFNDQISLLQERKQIIINEVVTGKVKVS